jgi:hypothetical protein
MFDRDCKPAHRRGNQIGKLAGLRASFLGGIVLWGALACRAVWAQRAGVHYFHQGNLPPGLVGAIRLQAGGPVVGYFQPVQFRGPSNLHISAAENGNFTEPQPVPVTLGLLVGQVYRFRVTHIPLFPGREVYPTVEIIDRLYPPQGLEWQYPIVVELTLEDLRLALEGRFVTRVVYLEDPQKALPIGESPKEQNWFEAPAGADPLAIADQLGRPVAIVRLGGRLPQNYPVPEPEFLYGCPPLLRNGPAAPQAGTWSQVTQESNSLAPQLVPSAPITAFGRGSFPSFLR